MSAIQKAIIKATDIDGPKKGEDRQDFIKRCVKAINALSDDDYDNLPKEVVKWIGVVADVADANKKAKKPADLPDFPDMEEEQQGEDEPRTRRRAAADEDDAPARKKKDEDDEPSIKIGANVTVVKKNGREIVGKLVERSKDLLVVQTEDGKEREIEMDDVGTIETVNDGARSKVDDEPADALVVGVTVKFTTKRGRDVEGKVLELDDEVILIKTDDDPKGEEFTRSRIDGDITVVGGGKTARSKAGDEDDAPARKKKDDKKDAGDDKPARSKNEPGVSIGQRVRELIVEDLTASVEDIVKALKKEGLEFRENTVTLAYNENHKLIKLLKSAKFLK